MKAEKLEFDIHANFNDVKQYVIANKKKFKLKSLSDSLVIKGIGEKYLKIENNFYSWIEIENALNDYEEGKIINEVILSILSWLFVDIDISNSYIPKKFNLDEDFSKIKKEVLNHKEFYKKGMISGIGENKIKVTTYKNKDYYIEWDEIKEVVAKIRYTSFEDLEEKRFSTIIIKQLFNDNNRIFTEEELKILNEKNGKLKLKYYKLCQYAKLSYKLIKEENSDITIVKEIVKLGLKWNNGQLPLNINEDGVNHIILSKSSLVRADFRKNQQYTNMLAKQLGEDYKVYSIQYSDEYIYHTHTYKNLIKYEKDGVKWIVTYSNRNLLENAFIKEINSHWICETNTTKSTVICTINDYENEDNVFNPDLFTKLYEDFHR